jgi:hypothetical protein
MKKRSCVNRIAGVSAAAYTTFVTAVALGAVTDVTGDVILMAPPASVLPDAPFSDTSVIHGFVEQRELVLPALVEVDHAQKDQRLTIDAGTCVTVYMLHFDATTPSSARGRLELTAPILGVISTQRLLELTDDVLGNTPSTPDAGGAGDTSDAGVAGTRYPDTSECQVAPPGSGNCGLEFNDVIDLQPQSIEVELHANGPGDRVRVIARCDERLARSVASRLPG